MTGKDARAVAERLGGEANVVGYTPGMPNPTPRWEIALSVERAEAIADALGFYAKADSWEEQIVGGWQEPEYGVPTEEVGPNMARAALDQDQSEDFVTVDLSRDEEEEPDGV